MSLASPSPPSSLRSSDSDRAVGGQVDVYFSADVETDGPFQARSPCFRSESRWRAPLTAVGS